MSYPPNGGSIPNPMPVSAPAGGMPVKSATPLEVSAPSALPVSITSPSTMPVSSSVPLQVVGPAANSSAASGNPVVLAGVVATTTGLSDTAGNVQRHTMTTGKQLVVKPYGLPESDWQYAAGAGGITNTAVVQIKNSPGAGLRNYITELSIQNGSALGILATEFIVSDGTSVLYRGFCGIGSNVQLFFNTPRRAAINSALTVQCLTAGAAIYVNSAGYVAP